MKSNLKIRRTMLAALMVFATAAIGLQPLVFTSGSDCTCDPIASASADTAGIGSSCCDSLAEEQAHTGCCSSVPAMATKCCCNPEAKVCQCVDCHCGEAETPSVPDPAIPANETTEVVSPTLICAAPFVCYPKASEINRTGFPRTVAEFAALSSQQTCVLLSRFTC